MPRQIQTTNIHTHSGTHKLLFRDKVVVEQTENNPQTPQYTMANIANPRSSFKERDAKIEHFLFISIRTN